MDISEMRQKDISELRSALFEAKEKLRELKAQLFSGKIKNVKEIRKIKKIIARILTVMGEKLKRTVNNKK